MCHCNEHKLSAFQVKRPEQKTALNAKTEQFTTTKTQLGFALKQWSKTRSTLRQDSSQMQKHQAARMSCRTAVQQGRYAHGRPQKFFQGGGNIDILLIFFKLLTMQRK